MAPFLVRLLASGFGTGYAPIASGTFGTLPAIPLALAATLLPPWLFVLLLALSVPFGIYLCSAAERFGAVKDPGWIVFDEMAGFWFATAFLKPTPASYLAAFFLFRLFDIIKIWPANWLDRSAPGGWGILLDDVVSGIYTRLALLALASFGLLA
jgi:phosphatidylglycerophosphatase A